MNSISNFAPSNRMGRAAPDGEYSCPVDECDFTSETWEEYRGHINGKRSYCESHDDLPPMKKWEMREYRL